MAKTFNRQYAMKKVSYCPECGKPISSTVKFCPECGYKLALASVEASVSEKDEDQEYDADDEDQDDDTLSSSDISVEDDYEEYEEEDEEYEDDSEYEDELDEEDIGPDEEDYDTEDDEDYEEDEDEAAKPAKNTAKAVRTPIKRDITKRPPEPLVNQSNKEDRANINTSGESSMNGKTMKGKVPAQDKAINADEPPVDAYDPNYDHYYDDIKPEIDDVIYRIPKENILKGIAAVAFLFVAIVYLIFNLR